VSAAPTTPNAPTGKSGRSLRRIRNFIIRVRRAGVPHEETVIIPAVAVDLISTVAGPSGWQLWLPFSAFAVIVFICAAWLALAWRRFPLLAFLRPVYSGVLATILWMATHDTPNTKQDIIRWISLISFGILTIFYPSFVVGVFIRDAVLKEGRGYYREQQITYPKRKKWKERLHRISRSKFIQSSMNLQGLAAVLVIIINIGPAVLLIISSIRFVIQGGIGAVFAIFPGAH
jgi:hypothetical protein